MSLADARDAAFEMRRKVAQGIDPVAERKKERAIVPTFKEAAKSGSPMKDWAEFCLPGSSVSTTHDVDSEPNKWVV